MELQLKMCDKNNLYTECSSAKRPRKPLLWFPFLLSSHITQDIATCCLFVYTSKSGTVWNPSSCLLTCWWRSGYFWTATEKGFPNHCWLLSVCWEVSGMEEHNSVQNLSAVHSALYINGCCWRYLAVFCPGLNSMVLFTTECWHWAHDGG